ncbi:MAG: 16S rRNA (guanine(527)-N(7))-methyltransferase RsmG [bacterium]
MVSVEEFLERAEISDANDRAAAIEKYVDLLIEFNNSMNLIGPMKKPEIIAELILDSLVPLLIWPPGIEVLDVGSGAGLPGIPLAIARPDLQFRLVEPRKKRSQFLKIVANRLGLKNVRVWANRLEELPVQPVDVAISKAVFSPVDFLKNLGPWTANGGFMISMCASDALGELERYAAEHALKKCAEISDAAQVTGHATEIQRSVLVWQTPD